jgi:hypothetical protein
MTKNIGMSSWPFIGTLLLLVAHFGCEGPLGAQIGQDAAFGGESSEVDAAAPEARIAVTTSGTVTCTADDDCESHHCADGVCCDTACDQACQSCNQTDKIGRCSPVKGERDEDHCASGSTCTDDGTCLGDRGQACASSADCAAGACVDGVCCATSMCGVCQSCTVAGSKGTCAPVARLAEDPGSQCVGDKACNGVGGCQKTNGTACLVSTECLSNFCVDGVCCNERCDGTCLSCAGPGGAGTCRPLDGLPDDNAATPCTGAHVCQSIGNNGPACKLAEGQACQVDGDCYGRSCPSFFADHDGDGYGSAEIRNCATSPTPPPGFVVTSGDCCDFDPGANPAETAYHTGVNACGTYNWNCVNGNEPKYPSCETVGSIACGAPCLGNANGHIGLLWTQACR